MADLPAGSFSIGDGEWQYNPKFHDFATFLGLIDRDAKGTDWKADKDTREKVGQLYLWGALKSDSDDHQKIKNEVYKLQRAVGVNWVGKSLVDKLWQHTIFDTDFKAKLQKLGETQSKPESAKPEKKAKPKRKRRKKKTQVGKKEIEQSVTKVKKQVKKQVEKQTKKAVQDAIQEGIKSAFK